MPESDDYEVDSSYSNRENKAAKTMSTFSGTDVIIKHQGKQSSAHEKKHRNERGKTVILGDSQLHHIEENKLSSETNKILVRSKGGLKVNEVIDPFGDI